MSSQQQQATQRAIDSFVACCRLINMQQEGSRSCHDPSMPTYYRSQTFGDLQAAQVHFGESTVQHKHKTCRGVVSLYEADRDNVVEPAQQKSLQQKSNDVPGVQLAHVSATMQTELLSRVDAGSQTPAPRVDRKLRRLHRRQRARDEPETKIRVLERRLRGGQKACRNAQSRFEGCQKELDNAKKQMQTAQAWTNGFIQALSEKLDQNFQLSLTVPSEVTSAIDDLQSEIAELRQQLSRQKARKAMSKERNEKKVSKLKKEIQMQVQKRRESLIIEKIKHDEALKGKDKEIEELDRLNADLEADKTDHDEAMGGLQAQVNELNQINEVFQRKQEVDAENYRLMEETKDLANENEKMADSLLEKTKKDHDKEMAELKQTYEVDYEQKLQEIREQIAKKKKWVSEAERAKHMTANSGHGGGAQSMKEARSMKAMAKVGNKNSRLQTGSSIRKPQSKKQQATCEKANYMDRWVTKPAVSKDLHKSLKAAKPITCDDLASAFGELKSIRNAEDDDSDDDSEEEDSDEDMNTGNHGKEYTGAESQNFESGVYNGCVEDSSGGENEDEVVEDPTAGIDDSGYHSAITDNTDVNESVESTGVIIFQTFGDSNNVQTDDVVKEVSPRTTPAL